MRIPLRNMRRGFTLLELTVAMMMGMLIGAMSLAMFNQQMAFIKIYKAQNFLTEEAPVVSHYVSRLIGKADRFRLHDSLADALAGKKPTTPTSPVITLNFRQPDGTMRASILEFRKTEKILYYYVVPTTGALGSPQWSVTRTAADVAFSIDQGVLRMALTGPAGEKITFSGTMQQ